MLITNPALLATPRAGNRSRDSCDPIGVVSHRHPLTSLLGQERIESKSLTFWIQIRTTETYLTQNANNFFTRTPNWVIIFLLEIKYRALSNPIGFTFKFIWSIEISTKQSDAAAESESNNKSKGVASPPLGPMSLVRPMVSFRLPWDVLPPPWPPLLAPI